MFKENEDAVNESLFNALPRSVRAATHRIAVKQTQLEILSKRVEEEGVIYERMRHDLCALANELEAAKTELRNVCHSVALEATRED